MRFHTIKKKVSKILCPRGHERWKDLLLSEFQMLFLQFQLFVACSIPNINYILIQNKYSVKQKGKNIIKKTFQGILLTDTF